MSEILELQKELIKYNGYLVAKLSEQKGLIEKSAQAEHDYRIALACEISKKRIEGIPVTIIPDLCRGDKNVAKLKMDRDIAQGVADACKEAIKSIRAAMSGLQSLISTKKEEMKLL